MDCPVCDSEAEDITASDFDGKSVRCPSCGKYDIAGSVYDAGTLQRMAREERLSVLKKAKRFAADGEKPMITTHTL